jgi:ABC-2 type transport system permease protein
VVNDDRSPLTEKVLSLMREQTAFEVESDIFVTNDQWPIEKLVRAIMRERSADVVVYFPGGLQHRLDQRESVVIRMFNEGTNPLARQVVDVILTQLIVGTAEQRQRDLVQAVTQAPVPLSRVEPRMTSSADRAPQIVPTGHMRLRESQQEMAGSPLERNHPSLSSAVGGGTLVTVENSDVFAASKHNPKIAMYAAGIAVMFLLFSATGAGGSLLEEYEAGTLDRLLASRLTITELLIGKWIYIAGLGFVQLSVMFVWAYAAFGVDLPGHLPGFVVMTVCTTAATASLALCLSVLCKSRTQLNGVSIVLILTMSALGGSMVPRYIMSDQMQRWGQWTFNAWALDGFKKVFWYDLPPSALQNEVRVLLFMTFTLACLARVCAARWSTD